MDKKLIVANWKNHPNSLAEATQILDSVDEYLGSLTEDEKFGLVFCPPFVFLEEVGRILKSSHLLHQAELGAQDISTDERKSLTGSALNKLNARYVIIGHSDRRWKLDESDETVNKKLKLALQNELVPIVCLGEKLRDDNFKNFLEQQTLNTFAGLTSDEISRCIIAYEPVWAISTTLGSHPDTPQNALESIQAIREALISNFEFRISNLFLYGGSVTSANVREFLSNEGFDGVLIGSASVIKEEFVRILRQILSLTFGSKRRIIKE